MSNRFLFVRGSFPKEAGAVKWTRTALNLGEEGEKSFPGRETFIDRPYGKRNNGKCEGWKKGDGTVAQGGCPEPRE